MVSTGLDAGDRVIRSQVGTALPGMRLRTADSAPTTTAQASPDANEADATQGTP